MGNLCCVDGQKGIGPDDMRGGRGRKSNMQRKQKLENDINQLGKMRLDTENDCIKSTVYDPRTTTYQIEEYIDNEKPIQSKTIIILEYFKLELVQMLPLIKQTCQPMHDKYKEK